MIAETIKAIHAASRGCHGVRRIHAELTIGMGIQIGSGQVHLIMKRTGVQGMSGTRKQYINKENMAIFHNRQRRHSRLGWLTP
ncbi:IS3 family transposase [Nocardia vulneris]|uniref:IS3 family transposase n=1 Tax=Nocardia vulneris TaxID=1141657 RepID=UPI0030D35D3C